MKAIMLQRFGAPEVLALLDTDIPAPKADEVLIRMHAAGLNPIDAKTRQGLGFAAAAIKDQLPHKPWIPGYDAAGIIEAVGTNVSSLKVGDAVYGMIGFPNAGGAYAEYACAEAIHVIKKPERLGFAEAAATPLAALTAWQALYEHGHISAGDRVLIHAAAGGVGHFAAQFAKAHGATVIATASASNRAFVLDTLGVDEFIDYQEQPFQEVTGDIDFVLDTIGAETGIRSASILKSGGTMVTLPTITADRVIEAATAAGANAKGMLVHPDSAMLEAITDMIETDRVKPCIGARYPLAEAASAHRAIERGHACGKTVLQIINEQ